MKKLLVLLVIITCIVFGVLPVYAKVTDKSTSKSNWEITKELCRKEGYKKIKLIDTNNSTDKQAWKIIDHRKGKNYIVVEKVVSVSDGTGYGWYSTKTKGTNYIIGYNKKVPKGRKVTSYVIWNPANNECDDILYVIDNKAFR